MLYLNLLIQYIGQVLAVQSFCAVYEFMWKSSLDFAVICISDLFIYFFYNIEFNNH